MFWGDRDKLFTIDTEKLDQTSNIKKITDHLKKKEYQSSDETGSEQRFHNRVEKFKESKIPKIKHHSWWFIHNCVAHPLIGIFPHRLTFDFHDYTSKKINAE